MLKKKKEMDSEEEEMEMGSEEELEIVDLTDADNDTVISVYKKMAEDDEIEIVKTEEGVEETSIPPQHSLFATRLHFEGQQGSEGVKREIRHRVTQKSFTHAISRDELQNVPPQCL